MFKLFLFTVTFFVSLRAAPQAVITKMPFVKTIGDFGAVPNDSKDDSWAFIKAGKYFSNLWDINGVPLQKGKINFSYAQYSGQLIIPSGKYLVGKQIAIPATGLSTTYGNLFGSPKANAPLTFAAGSSFRVGLELIKIENVDQFQLTGTGITAPIIQYNDGLVIGYFNNKAEPIWYPESAYEGKHFANVGSFIDVVNCKNIVLQNISIDGNNYETKGKTMYNGGWRADGIQLGASGAVFVNTKKVTITKMDVHHMTLDGLIFNDFYRDSLRFPKQEMSNVYIADSKFDYNRRQGFSWVGGRKLTVVNSSFSHTGTSVNSVGVARGNPGAGLDIEAESDGTNLLYCIDGSFTNCSFVNNRGLALGNDITAGRSKNMTFMNSIFHDVDGYSVWIKGRSFTFRNCKIWGGFAYGNDGKLEGEETKFYNCDFADEELPSRPGVFNKGFALVESWSVAKRLSFFDCTFRTLHAEQRLTAIYTPEKTESAFTVFSNCSFVSKVGGNINVLFGCIFNGNTNIKNLGKQDEIFSLNGFIAKGSSLANQPYSFNVSGKVFLSPANSNGPGLTQFVIGRSQQGKANKGYLNFTIGTESCLYGYWSQVIDIGQNSVLLNNGQLAMLSGTINLDGKLKLNEGSNTAFFTPVIFNSSFDKRAELTYEKASRFGVSDRWKTKLAGLGPGLPFSGIAVPPKIKVVKAL